MNLNQGTEETDYTLAEIQQAIVSYETSGLDCIAGKDQVLEKVGKSRNKSVR